MMDDLPPLIASERTEHANPKCFASVSRDCSSKISREHWLSANILDNISDGRFNVTGLRWMGGEQRELTTSSLQSKILCERHNGALSPLDTEVGRLFKVCQIYQNTMEARENVRLFSLFSGSTIERWLLKFLLGAVASKTFRSSAHPETKPLARADTAQLIEYLFREAGSNPTIALFQDHNNGVPMTRLADVEMAATYRDDGTVWACGIAFGPAKLNLAIGPIPSESPGRSIIVRPAGIVITSAVSDTQAVVSFAWESPGSGMTTYTYTGEQGREHGAFA